MYDDAPRARRHGGLATALALIGCAMLGTAGAYGYRQLLRPSGALAAAAGDHRRQFDAEQDYPSARQRSTIGKIIQDRLANAGKEQIVSKQEEPVALKDLGTQAAPRVVLPAPVAPAPAASPQAPGRSSGAAGSNEPKKVRTVTIRPDGTDASGRPGGAPSPVAQATGQAGGAAAPRGGPAPAARGSGGPLSLDPQAGEPAAAPAVSDTCRNGARGDAPRDRSPRAIHQAGSWCNSPRKNPRPKRVPPSEVCKPSSPTSSPEEIRSYGGRIWVPKGCSTGPWWGRSRRRKTPTSSVQASRPPAAIALFRATEFALTTIMCAG